MEEARGGRQKIIIMCEHEDVGLVEEGLNKIDYAKAQGTIEITYDPKLPISTLREIKRMEEKKEWWEYLDWSRMKTTFQLLPESKQKEILGGGFWSCGKGKFADKEN